MRVARLLLSLFFVFSSSPRLNSQQQLVAAVQRDPQAAALLQHSAAALGGALSSTSVIAHGTLTAVPPGISGPILWETQGSEFRYDRPGPNGTITFVSGHGDPAIADSGHVRRNIGHLAMTNLPPHMVAATLASYLSNSAIQISTIQSVTLNGTAALKVSATDTSDELSKLICKQDWYLDPSTLLPIRVDFLASEARNALDTAKMTYIFSNWHNVSGVLMPFDVVTLFEGQQIFSVSFDSIEIGVPIPTTDFDVPPAVAGGTL
jgi:hypothetical protein